jgi:hypothetical protein
MHSLLKEFSASTLPYPGIATGVFFLGWMVAYVSLYGD